MKLITLYYFVKLCRPVNLAIIALTMYLIHFNILGYLMELMENDYQEVVYPVSDFDFFLLVFSTVLIAGAGYIINDYFDMRIDRINKPEKVIVGKYIKKRIAMLTHTGMNIIAVLIGIYLSLKYDSWLPLSFHVITTSLLWWYSVHLKRKFLSGNLVIAVLSGMVPLLVGWFEYPVLKESYGPMVAATDTNQNMFRFTEFLILGYCLMAAVTTLIREIQKDMADMKGDETQHCKTIPIVLGIEKTKYIVTILILASVFTLIGFQAFYFTTTREAFYIMTFICLPLVISAVITHYGKEREKFLLASNFIKISMLGALLFTFMIHA